MRILAAAPSSTDWLKRAASGLKIESIALGRCEPLSKYVSDGPVIIAKDVLDAWHTGFPEFDEKRSVILVQGAGTPLSASGPLPVSLAAATARAWMNGLTP